MASALPSGSQSYYFAYRYNAQKDLISSNIVLSTFVSFFTLSIFVIHDKLSSDPTEPIRANLYDSSILNMYNWKYIT